MRDGHLDRREAEDHLRRGIPFFDVKRRHAVVSWGGADVRRETALAGRLQQAGEYINRAFEQTTGFERGEVIGKTPRVLKSGLQDAAFYERLWGTLLADFIPLLEETGMIVPVGQWVLQTACRDSAHWRAAGLIRRRAGTGPLRRRCPNPARLPGSGRIPATSGNQVELTKVSLEVRCAAPGHGACGHGMKRSRQTDG